MGTEAALAQTNGTAILASPKSKVDDALPSERMFRYCEFIANSNLVPKDFRGRPADVMLAIQLGSEVGLAPAQALQSIAVINGRPSLYGDGALAVVRARRDCEDVQESINGTGDARVATCTIVRAGQSPVTRTFSILDAKRAKLFDKDGPWKQYPDRMLQMRARGFALRDAFPDALKGFAIAEEAMDIPDGDKPTTQAAPAATRTDSILAKVVGSSEATAQPASAAAAPSEEQSAPEAQIREDDASDTKASAEDLQKHRELRNAIARAWQGVDPSKRATILAREYAKSALTDLDVDQLQDFLERTPELIEGITE